MRELNIDSNTGECSDVEINNQSDIETDDSCWHLKELEPISYDKIIVDIPLDILLLVRNIEELMTQTQTKNCEFGVFLSGKFNNGILTLTSDYYLPDQKVNSVHIDFNDVPPEGFNGVIHRHPSHCKRFSHEDNMHINRNFEFSLLYVDNNIDSGIVNIKSNGAVFQLPLTPRIIYPHFESVALEEIKAKIHGYPPPKTTYRASNDWKSGNPFNKIGATQWYPPSCKTTTVDVDDECYECTSCDSVYPSTYPGSTCVFCKGDLIKIVPEMEGLFI